MVTRPRQTIATFVIAGLVLVCSACTSHAGWISSLDSANLSQILFGDDLSLALSPDTAGSMASSHVPPDQSGDNGSSPWHLLLLPMETAAMQAGQSAGMSGTSLSITGSSSSSSQAALIGPPLDLSDQPLRSRLLDEPKLILPTGPVCELLRPA